MNWKRIFFVGTALVGFLLGAHYSQAQGPVKEKLRRLVFRAKGEKDYQALLQQIPAPLRQQLRQHFLGLSEAKIRKLRELSGGRVDFSGIYSLDMPKNRLAALDKIKLLSSIIEPDVLPPVFVTDAELQGDNGWWAQGIQTQPIWDLGYSGRGVTIADCDAGYHTEEPDIRANLILDLGYDVADTQNPTVINDGNFVSHGTSVVAIMSGVHGNGGTNGIAYNSRVVPLQNFNYDANLDDLGKEEATAQCILRALQTPEVRIIVLENQTARGSSETYAGTREAVRLALQSGVTIVSAGGNSSAPLTAEAQDDTGSIIVGALAQDGSVADFSNYGTRITVAAFGENLHTLEGPNGVMGSFGGTSGATPQVAGAVALMLEANPNLSPAQIKEILVQTRVASEATALVGGKLNIDAAVRRTLETVNAQQLLTRQAAETFRTEAVRILQENI